MDIPKVDATSRKVEDSNPDEATGLFFSIYLHPHYCSGVYSSSNRNEYEEYSLGRGV
jgi:hypothetical protein